MANRGPINCWVDENDMLLPLIVSRAALQTINGKNIKMGQQQVIQLSSFAQDELKTYNDSLGFYSFAYPENFEIKNGISIELKRSNILNLYM